MCYDHNQGSKGDKFTRVANVFLLGIHPYGEKSWKLYDLQTDEYFILFLFKQQVLSSYENIKKRLLLIIDRLMMILKETLELSIMNTNQ